MEPKFISLVKSKDQKPVPQMIPKHILSCFNPRIEHSLCKNRNPRWWEEMHHGFRTPIRLSFTQSSFWLWFLWAEPLTITFDWVNYVESNVKTIRDVVLHLIWCTTTYLGLVVLGIHLLCRRWSDKRWHHTPKLLYSNIHFLQVLTSHQSSGLWTGQK